MPRVEWKETEHRNQWHASVGPFHCIVTGGDGFVATAYCRSGDDGSGASLGRHATREAAAHACLTWVRHQLVALERDVLAALVDPAPTPIAAALPRAEVA